MNQSLLVFLVFISALAIGLILLQVMFGTGANIGDRLVAPTDSLAAAGALPSWLLGSSNLLRWNAQRLRQNKGQNAKVEKLQNALTNAGYRGVEAVALFQLTRAAVMIAAVLFGCALGLWTGAH